MVHRLRFDKPLLGSVGKPIGTKELLTRLQSLSDELSAVDQDDADTRSYKKIASDLSNPKLLKNANSGVQAFTCCCIADILRIYAPDAPFTSAELLAIFKLFFSQLKHLCDQENPYFYQQNYLLKRLAEVRSIILITDLPDADTLVDSLFHMFYDLASKDFPVKLESLVSDMLAEVISESETIPANTLKLILNKFLTANDRLTTVASNISNPAYNFSLHVCEANVHKMARQVTQFFSEMLNESAPTPEDTSVSESALRTLEKIHNLSIQIWKSVPDLLGSFMGLLNDELNTEHEKIRLLATSTIGCMIASNSENASFTMAHKSTWLNWLKKTVDVSPTVRAKWVEQLPDIFNHASFTTDTMSELRNGLIKCLLDTNDKVRFTTCKSIEKITFDAFTSVVANKFIFNTLFQLIREKNSDVRNKVIRILSDIYDKYYVSVSEGKVVNFGDSNAEEIAELENLISEGIPNHILALNYINDKNITLTVDVVLFEKLLSFDTNAVKRVSRLAHFYSSLDEKSKTSFNAICKRQQKQSDALDQFILLAEEWARPLSDKENIEENSKESRQLLSDKLDKVMKWFAASFPQGLNTFTCLERFLRLKNIRFYNLVKFCISPDSDYKTIKNAIKELLTKLNEAKNIKLDSDRTLVTTADMTSNFKALLYRSSTILYNKANVAELINYSKDPKHEFFAAASEILENISSTIPDVFRIHLKSLVDVVMEEAPIEGFSPKANNLRTIYHILKKLPELFPKSSEFVDALKETALSGRPLEARYAVKILGLSLRKEFYASELTNTILPLDPGNTYFVTHLATIAGLYLVDPMSLEDHADEINTLLIEKVLREKRQFAIEQSDESWIDDLDLDLELELNSVLYEMILAVRIIVNRMRSLANGSEMASNVSDQKFKEVVAKPLKLVMLLITHCGELVDKSTPKSYQQKLRLNSGLSVLKLARYPRFFELFDYKVINRLALLLHDTSINVRRDFVTKLQVNLWNASVPTSFLHLVFLMAHEPDHELKNQVVSWIHASHKRFAEENDVKVERSLVRLIHFLAHDSNFAQYLKEDRTKAFKYGAEFFIFFLETTAKQDNLSLLYYFASRVKQYRDATIQQDLYSYPELPEEVLNIYRSAELCQLSIQVMSEVKHWSLQTWPGKIKLPMDLFAPMENYEEAQKIISTVYVGDEVQADLRYYLKRRLGNPKRKTAVGSPKRKTAGGSPKPKRAKPARKPVKRKEKESVELVEPVEPSRKSTRATNKVSYADYDSDESE